MRLRRFVVPLLLVLAVAAIAAAAAGPAAASPPVGTLYCMDGTETFATWDAFAADVTDQLVTSFGGVLTIGEADPANIGRDVVRQYFDALETSDAIGGPGVDTTIPNWEVHQITGGPCPALPSTENNVFLCYSKYTDQPGVWPAGQAQALISDGYWAPSAMDGAVDGGTNVGSFHLVCNPPASDSRLAASAEPAFYVGADGGVFDSIAAGLPGYYPYAG